MKDPQSQTGKTPEEFAQQLRRVFGTSDSDQLVSSRDLKYIIYARKSTESAERQIRSLDDQVAECREMAEKMKLQVVKIVKESESAKEPEIRPLFRKMLDDVKQAKYDGILAWHPDRLARNMKEAGEVIDLLDKQIIKDLRFVSFTFENTTSGKMLLGISFVLSKEYSDKLSDNVRRGIRRSIEEGKYIHHPKHGYYKDRNSFLRPDPESFSLIKESFQRRLEGQRLEEIAAFLNERSYSRVVKTGKREVYLMSVKRISEILRDPFYAGVLLYGNQVIDYTEVYDFVPMISPEDFLKINKIEDIKKAFKFTASFQKPGAVSADLMRGMVTCGICEETLTAGITSKKAKGGTTRYYYFRCDNNQCEAYGKSTRARVIMDFAKDFLKKHPLSSKKAHQRYIEEMQFTYNTKVELHKKEMASLQQIRKTTEQKFENSKILFSGETDDEMKKILKDDIKLFGKKVADLNQRLETVKQQKEGLKGVILDYSAFLELFAELPNLLEKMTKIEDLDFIMRKVFLNFVIKDKKVARVSLNHPFSELMETSEFRFGRGTGN